ncbi:heparinase II/III domain-containing protein [Thalassotalea sediminis]|uniref:heparinase II/III domain-containing protein n=1 Tax=Thalassotalea sediminis TaxID=1759089 RepID=UPI0025738F6E|nr:heparinase II/III family protein [Thalassotalea sediminis]
MLSKLVTYYRLGITNVLAVAFYRVKVKIGYFEKIMPIDKQSYPDRFFTTMNNDNGNENIRTVDTKAFGWMPVDVKQDIDWLTSIINHHHITNNRRHWSRISDFALAIGDIKGVWELSRFTWLFSLTLQYLKTGKQAYLQRLNLHLNQWLESNPVNQGVNWKCGQEASIRVMHLAATAHLLHQDKELSSSLKLLLTAHLQRIAPTVSYAIAQDNNHGTSEAAALYIGSAVLLQQPACDNKAQLLTWLNLGRKTFENRCKKLIEEDGCFSQHSSNYHRLMLDCASLTEFFRDKYQLSAFSDAWYQALKHATLWLDSITDPSTGQTPILGLNDGAQLLPVTPCDYLDFRPSVQWAYQLFLKKTRYQQGDFQQLAQLFHNSEPLKVNEPTLHALNSDYQHLKRGHWRAFLSTPTAKFRPTQCDALHIDLWCGSDNIFIGTGTYSYNCHPKWQDYFPSTRAQNTVMFDEDEQMKKISRFLYADWIKVYVIERQSHTLSAKYNSKAHQHCRQVSLKDKQAIIIDTVNSFTKQACLRWHLSPSNWQLSGQTISNKYYKITLSSTVKINKLSLVEGWYSRYYLKKEPITVIELIIDRPGIITTTVSKVV